MELDDILPCLFSSRDHKLPFTLQLESVNIRNTYILSINSTFTQNTVLPTRDSMPILHNRL